MIQEGSVGRSRTHVLPKTQHAVRYIWSRSIRKALENQLNSYPTGKDEKTTQRCALAKTPQQSDPQLGNILKHDTNINQDIHT